ncbi:hypothetical protein [Pectinatus frisingensis]|uniref:hypothetical protein n=1 Tax=Pectinatus frisingensis TaxID=865 RepID=UPI0018C771E7|nr:hypothetical protein [Pectinatus frisingensis]
MSFMYVNPGYKGLFDIVDNTAVESTDVTFNNNKIAFHSTFNSNVNTDSIININSNEVYIKFDIYISAKGLCGADQTFLKITSANNTIIFNTPRNQYYYFIIKNNGSLLSPNINITNGLNTFIVHVKTDNILEVFINKLLVYQLYSTSILSGEQISKISINSSNFDNTSYNYLSNMIISDTDISGQQIAIVPVKTTSGSWTAGGNGVYTSDTLGQQLLQTLDIDSLKANMNVQGNVDYKSLSIAASPGYCDTGNLNTLKTIVKSNASAVNPESKQLTQNVNAGIYTQGLVINPLTGAPWTETDLRAISVGLESAEAS